MTITKNDRLDPGFWIGLVMIGILIYLTQQCK